MLCSGCAICTISTLSNWCWRIMPRVSRPAEPASERKHGLCAVSLTGSVLGLRGSRSRTVLVSEISEVEIRYCSALLLVAAAQHPEHVFLELGQLAGALEDLAVDDVGRVALGVAVLVGLHVQHELRERAVQARDAGPRRKVKREPESLAPVSKSRPSGAPRSTWSFTAKSNVRGVPQRRTSTLPVSSAPAGTLSSGRLGTPISMALSSRLQRLEALGAGLQLVADAGHLGHHGRGVLALALEHADLLAAGCCGAPAAPRCAVCSVLRSASSAV